MRTKLLILLLILLKGNVLSAGTWEDLETKFNPSSRSGHIAVYDSVSHSMVIMGDDGCSDSDVHYLDLRNKEWIVRGSSDTVKRAGQSAIYDSDKNRVIIFGGSVSGRSSLTGFENKVYVWDFDAKSWELLTTSGIPPLERIYHSAIYDSENNRMIIFGGKAKDGNYKNDVYALNLGSIPPAWEELVTTRTSPQVRIKHTAIYDSKNKRMIIFGGSSVLGHASNDIYSLDLITLEWEQLSATGTPPPERTGHTSVYDPDTGLSGSMIVFGGTDPLPGRYLNDTYILDLDQMVWKKVQPGLNQPPGRSDHTAVYDTDENRMIIFGGYNGSNNLNDCYTLNIIDRWPPSSSRGEVFNYPNPFSAGSEQTHICFYLDKASRVSIKIFSLVGDLVKEWSVDGQRGINEVLWDGYNGIGRLVENGGYICLIDKSNSISRFKIAVLK